MPALTSRCARPAPPPATGHDPGANERFKRAAGAWTWLGLIVATVVHFVVFAAWPTLTAEVRSSSAEVTELVIPEEVDFPDPPEEIRRPPSPVAADVPDDVVPPPDRYYWDMEPAPLAPPPVEKKPTGGEGLPFVPTTALPVLTNPREMRAVLERAYPPLLRDAGIGGEVVLHLHLDEEGRVVEAKVGTGSGRSALDDAALEVVPVLRFEPAYNKDRAVAVWIQLPVVFTVRTPLS